MIQKLAISFLPKLYMNFHLNLNLTIKLFEQKISYSDLAINHLILHTIMISNTFIFKQFNAI